MTALAFAVVLASRLAAAPAQPAAGVLVMAHGGDSEWDRAVHEAVAPLEGRAPVELALGMADADALQAAIARLEARGVRRIAVVRLFMSGDSFLARTRKILGLEPGAPPKPKDAAEAHAHGGPSGHDGPPRGQRFHDPDTMPLWRVATRSRIVLDETGLLDSDIAARILAERAATLSKDAARESLLLLGHGHGDEAENARWLERMERVAAKVREAKPFREVRVETLREDWPARRRESEARIRAFVARAAKDGSALVVPLRLYGFGPYAETLKGLAYESDGLGIVPHPLVGDWLVERTAELFKRAGWQPVALPSPDARERIQRSQQLD